MPSPLTITAANTIPGSGANIVNGTAGEAIAIGQACFLKDSDSRYYLSDANDTAKDECDGVAVSTAAAAGQPIAVQTSGTLAFGAILTNGALYFVGSTPGNINPVADLTTGWQVIVIGVATSTGNMLLRPWETGAIL